MRPGTRETAGRSFHCETFDRFLDKAKSLGLEVALGDAHIPTNPDARCEVPDSAAAWRCSRPTEPACLRAAGAQAVWYLRTGHQTCG